MIATRIDNRPVSLTSRSISGENLELSRLMAAAVINPKFCALLLDNPELALDSGFRGETFLFTEEERDLILSIRADSLAELARQLARTFNGPQPIHINNSVQPTAVFRF
jgi:hypothetical protein